MSELLSKASFAGTVSQLLASPDRETGLEKQRHDRLMLRFDGIETDCHGGLTRKSDSRMLKQFRRGTEVKNARQVSILSEEELVDIAANIGIQADEEVQLGNPVTVWLPPRWQYAYE